MSQRRVEYVVRHLSQAPVWSKDVPTVLPEDTSHYCTWFADGIAPLLATLRAADPDARVWTNGVDRHVRYWTRRILYEAVVHRADAELAMGQSPAIDPVIAADGIDEFLTNLLCFEWVADRLRTLCRDGDTLHMHASDSDGEWMIHLTSDAFNWEHTHGEATVTVQGSTSDLLLFVYGRLRPSPPKLGVVGEERLLRQWSEKSAF